MMLCGLIFPEDHSDLGCGGTLEGLGVRKPKPQPEQIEDPKDYFGGKETPNLL